jgi:hypothetical protein
VLVIADRQTQIHRAETIGGYFMADIELFKAGVSYDDICGCFRFRDEVIWLSQRTLDRCIGLPVTTTGDLSRLCGVVHSAYVDGDSVRGNVRLIDYGLIEIIKHHLAEYEFFTDLEFLPGDDEVIEIDDGEKCIIEGAPRLLKFVSLSVMKGEEDDD